MNKTLLILIGLAAVGGAFYLYQKKGGLVSVSYKRNYLSNSGSSQKFYSMTDDEVNAAYDFVTNYVEKNKQLPAGTTLYNQITTISKKYNIFT